jgi:hypothetical protein
MKKIKTIYTGVPDDIIEKIIWVDDRYRTNMLSLVPGGQDIIVEYWNGQIFGYDKVKIPPRYIEAILTGHFAFWQLLDGKFESTKQINNLYKAVESYVIEAFIRAGGNAEFLPYILLPPFLCNENGEWNAVEESVENHDKIIAWVRFGDNLTLTYHYINTKLDSGSLEKAIKDNEVKWGQPLPADFKISDQYYRDLMVKVTKQKLRRVFSKQYQNPGDKEIKEFHEIWNSLTSTNLPWECFDT